VIARQRRELRGLALHLAREIDDMVGGNELRQLGCASRLGYL
jgi:hypothetical protein